MSIGCSASIDERRYDGGSNPIAESLESQKRREIAADARRITGEFRDDPLQVIGRMIAVVKTRGDVTAAIESFIDALVRTECPLIAKAVREYAQWEATENAEYEL